MDPRYACFVGGLQAGSPDDLVELRLGLAHHRFDATRMDPTVLQEGLESAAGDLAPNRIEGRDDDGLGGVVDDEVNARRRFEGPDVAPLTADDAALQLLAGQTDQGNGALAAVLAGVALNGHGDDVLGGVLRSLAGGLLHLLQPAGDDPLVGLLHALEQLLLGLVA